MSEKMWPQAVGLVKAAHFGPTVLVVGITFVLALTQFSIGDAAFIALAFLLGQLVVGWTNDLLDFPRDKAAMRFNKPLVAGTITELTLRISIVIALLGALIISLVSPLGISGTAVHFLALLSATAYNVKLKSTVLSVVPYVFSFGALPWAIYLAAGTQPPNWIVLGFILFASAFHFLNVLKDLESDVAQQVMGLPQVIGRTKSIVTAALLAVLGIVDVVVANTVL
jgi:4-hydroxybenzoate polyprenyltransferase